MLTYKHQPLKDTPVIPRPANMLTDQHEQFCNVFQATVSNSFTNICILISLESAGKCLNTTLKTVLKLWFMERLQSLKVLRCSGCDSRVQRHVAAFTTLFPLLLG